MDSNEESSGNDPFLDDPTFVPIVIIYSITFLIGLVGNSLVVFAMLGDRKSRSVTSAFLVSLAIADILFLLWCVPYEIGHRFTAYWSGGKALCLMSAFVKVMCGVASVLNLVAVSVERFIVIVLPLRSRQLCTPGTSKKIIISVWFASVLLALPIFHFQNETVIEYEDNGTLITEVHCGRKNDINAFFSIYQLCIIFVIPSVVMSASYAMVIRVLWLSTKQLSKMTASSVRKPTHINGSKSSDMRQPLTTSPCTCERTPESAKMPPKRCCSCLEARLDKNSRCAPNARDHSLEMREARKQVIKMLITIVLVFLFCWGPAVILEVIHTFVMNAEIIDYSLVEALVYAKLACNALPFVQSSLNPVIYTFMSSNFRRNIRNLCMKCAMGLRFSSLFEKNVSEYELESKSGVTLSTHSRVMTRISGPPTSSSN